MVEYLDTHYIKCNEIKWGERCREDYGDIDDLAKSIKQHGLIQPIVLDDNNMLLAGGRRLTACILLELDNIPYVKFNNLTPLQKKEIELEENIRRKNFTWVEEIKIKKNIDELKKQIYGDIWKREDTAKLFNQTERYINRDIELANAILTISPELADEKDRTTAYSKMQRIKEKRMRELSISLNNNNIEVDDIRMGDAVELIKDIPDKSIDLILFDPPFGVDFHKQNRLDEYLSVYGDMEDDVKSILKLVNEVASHFSRILKDDGHCYIFFATRFYFKCDLYKVYQKYLNIAPYWLFWVKDTAYNPQPYNQFALNYEPILYCYKDKPRKFNKASYAVLKYTKLDAGNKDHPAEKPIELYKDLIEVSTIENEVILDPMMGSGASLVAGKQMGRKVIGFEQNEDWFNLCKYRLQNVKGGNKK